MIANILGNVPAESVNMIVISVTAAVIGLIILGYLIWNVACIKASNDAIEEKLSEIAESLAAKKRAETESKRKDVEK